MTIVDARTYLDGERAAVDAVDEREDDASLERRRRARRRQLDAERVRLRAGVVDEARRPLAYSHRENVLLLVRLRSVDVAVIDVDLHALYDAAEERRYNMARVTVCGSELE